MKSEIIAGGGMCFQEYTFGPYRTIQDYTGMYADLEDDTASDVQFWADTPENRAATAQEARNRAKHLTELAEFLETY